jgi:hypothetical protein
MSDFNYIEYLKNNPLFKGEKTQSTKLITEAQEDTIDSLQKAADDTAKMPADRDKARNKMYAMKKAKMKVSELKAKIREEILSTLNEEENTNVNILDRDYDLDQAIFTLNVDGKKISLTYYDYDEEFDKATYKEVMYNVKRKLTDLTPEQQEKVAQVVLQDLTQSGNWSNKLNEEEDYEKMGREVEYGVFPGFDEDELSMQDVFDMLDNEEFEDMEDMPIDEAKGDEEEAPAEEEMDAEVNVDVEAAPAQGLSAEEQEIQNSLKIAYDSAAAIGDQKLADQIGNSITFFTRTHVVER